jgi:hypothetical protein
LFPVLRYRQHVLGNVVAMYHAVHAAGCDANNEDGQNEAPMMDTMVALRLSIALMHGRKQQHMLVRNRYFSAVRVRDTISVGVCPYAQGCVGFRMSTGARVC